MGEPRLPTLPIDPPDDPAAGADLENLAWQLHAIAEQIRATHLATGWSGPGVVRNSRDAAASGIRHIDDVKRKYANPADRDRGYAGLAKRIYTLRRARDSVFGNAEMFGEPAWDILLDLYVAFAEDRLVSVSSACIGSAAPPTTGLRWLGILSDEGFILREHDPADQRRVLVRLSDKGVDAMQAYFEKAMTSV